MSGDLLQVERGLRLVTNGLWVMVATPLIGIGAAALGNGGQFALPLFGGCLLVGAVVRLAGRVACLRTPEGATTARARIRLAVLFEVCGWLSGLSNVGASLATSAGVLPIPPVVLAVTSIVSLVLFLVGRLFFLFYLPALADAVQDVALVDEARAVIRLSLGLFVGVSVFLGLIVFAASSGFGGSGNAFFIAICALALSAGLLVGGIKWFFRYKGLLGDLQTSIAHFDRANPVEHDDDPDAEYRQRYENEGSG